MTRIEEIKLLRRRYRNLMADRKIKSATPVWRRLSDLMFKQLKAENRGKS